jgi:hypothetical protein
VLLTDASEFVTYIFEPAIFSLEERSSRTAGTALAAQRSATMFTSSAARSIRAAAAPPIN